MSKIILSAILLVAVTMARPVEREDKIVLAVPQEHLPTKEEIVQNQNANYQFSSNIQDGINDLSNQRLEVRDGVNVKGMYSYSDGYFRRTIQYEADDKGYRVISEDVVPLEGPQVDLNGRASVDTAAHGTQVKYTVQSVPEDEKLTRLVETSPEETE